MQTEKEIFHSHIKAKGLKYTTERKRILEAVLSMPSHFEVDELHMKMRGQYNNKVSKATIYRTLPLMVEAGILREVLFVDKHAHYEHTYRHKHHEHLICIKCEKIIEFVNPQLENLLISVADTHQFEIQEHKLEMTGICKDCRAK
jgi:Fur family ferric uptake transcriptional regulator